MNFIPEQPLPLISWRDQAACRQPGLPADTFFPRDPNTKRRDPWEQARDICAWCPEHVREACLTEALDLGDFAGMRAGLTPDERRALKAAQR